VERLEIAETQIGNKEMGTIIALNMMKKQKMNKMEYYEKNKRLCYDEDGNLIEISMKSPSRGMKKERVVTLQKEK